LVLLTPLLSSFPHSLPPSPKQAADRDPIHPPPSSQHQPYNPRLPSYGAVHEENDDVPTGARGGGAAGWNHDLSRSSSPEHGRGTNGQYYHHHYQREQEVEDWKNGGSHPLYPSSFSSSSAAAAAAASADNNNNGTALESLSARGIWFLLFLPYLTLTLAHLVDTHPQYRVSSLQPIPPQIYPSIYALPRGNTTTEGGGQ